MTSYKKRWKMGAGICAALFVFAALAFLFAAHAAALAMAAGAAGTLMATAGAIVVPEEVTKALGEIKEGIKGNGEKVIKLATDHEESSKKLKALEDEYDQARKDLDQLRKQFLSRGSISTQRRAGFVSDAAAKGLASNVILGLARKGHFDSLECRDALIKSAGETFGLEMKAALTTSDIPLPTEYTQELKELVTEYGVARRVMTHYPIGRGTSKPARLGTQDDFTFPIAMSAPFTEKNVKLGNASLESHKGGGILRLPRELDEQSIIPLGQMLARYAARKFGKAEDTIGFLGDGTAGYDSIKGVIQIASENSAVITLGAGKTAPSDATLEDLRSLRGKVAVPVIGSGFYQLHITWERRLRTFKTQADPMIYVQNGPNGSPTLDGYPIIWNQVLAPYGTDPSASAPLAIFGDPSYWWFGEHGSPRTDFSTDVFFTTDELAVRWLEEIDFDYAAVDCCSALKTAAQ